MKPNVIQAQLGDQIIRYDRERTKKAYLTIAEGAAKRCGCLTCRNFDAQRETAFPEEFKRLLDELGIDHQKEADSHEWSGKGSLRKCGGWFYLAGELIEPGERLTDVVPGFQYFFRGAGIHGPLKDEFGPDLLALEFVAEVPWVLAEEPEH
jgi:hypothetical protein